MNFVLCFNMASLKPSLYYNNYAQGFVLKAALNLVSRASMLVHCDGCPFCENRCSKNLSPEIPDFFIYTGSERIALFIRLEGSIKTRTDLLDVEWQSVDRSDSCALQCHLWQTSVSGALLTELTEIMQKIGGNSLVGSIVQHGETHPTYAHNARVKAKSQGDSLVIWGCKPKTAKIPCTNNVLRFPYFQVDCICVNGLFETKAYKIVLP